MSWEAKFPASAGVLFASTEYGGFGRKVGSLSAGSGYLQKNPVVVAFEEGIGAVYPKVMECDRLTIGGRDYDASDMEIKLCEKSAGDSREALQYRFMTPHSVNSGEIFGDQILLAN